MEVKAILFDTRSIQQYIFSGNKLKTNIGASYLVDRVFDDVLFPIVEDVTKEAVDTESWKTSLNVKKLQQKNQCVVAANGGGSALLLFSYDTAEIEETNEKLMRIIRAFTKNLLVKCPGLHVGAAQGKIRLDELSFQKDLKELYKKLKENQNQSFPQVNIPYTGLTLSCQVNGEAANYFDKHGQVILGRSYEQRFCSQEVACKAKAAEEANKRLKAMYERISKCYEFPMQIDELGQKESENYFAIIHIDGNNMGAKFRTCKT